MSVELLQSYLHVCMKYVHHGLMHGNGANTSFHWITHTHKPQFADTTKPYGVTTG